MLTELMTAFPARSVNLVTTVAHTLSTTSSKSTKLDRDSLKRAWRLVRESPVLVIGALFPHTVREGEAQTSQKLLIARARALSPLGLTRHEARAKRKQLLKQRDQLAERLGSLTQKLSKSSRKDVTQPEELMQELSDRISDMHTALEVGSSEFNPATASLTTSLDAVLSQYVGAQRNRIDLVLSPSPMGSGEPSRAARLWPTFVLAPLGTIIVVRIVTSSWDTIVEKAKEARETVIGFAINWVYEPCLKLLDTIKTGDQEGVIMSKESLNSDLQSLERMVTEFSAEKYNLSGAQLDAVTQKVREGDMTTVLKIYESELKSPLKSAITGSLIRSLLIQIQKVKVDIAVAMRGVDQLLKSQQLLFGAIGIAPAMAITYYVGGFFKRRISTSLGQQGKEVGLDTRFRAWEAMRRIDRLLADPMLTSTSLPPLTQGLLLLDLSLLRSLSPLLLSQVSRGRKGTAKRLRVEFLQDVRDLEFSNDEVDVSQVGLGWHARRAAVDRMWKSWGSVISLAE
jgi:nuclear-control-of-ATPase protein 2